MVFVLATDEHGFSQISGIRVSSVPIRGPNMIAKTEKNETFSGAINLLQHKQTFSAF